MIEHSVKKVHIGTSPKYLNLQGEIRYNFTFRQTPKMIGREKEFQLENY
jgi:hypothetical protein